ncbi:hypothetical protein GCM10025785_01240 [Corynebacterium canis]
MQHNAAQIGTNQVKPPASKGPASPAYAFAMAPALLPQAPWVSRPRKYAVMATETQVTCTNNTDAVRHVCYRGNHMANR